MTPERYINIRSKLLKLYQCNKCGEQLYTGVDLFKHREKMHLLKTTMTPETAKTKITQLLELGTLQGVKVEYENSVVTFHRQPMPGEDIAHSLYLADQPIKSIHPIPLQPKLLEVGTRVKIIGGRMEGAIGTIADYYLEMEQCNSVYRITDTGKVDVWGISFLVENYNVIPESLLVEEEECKHEEQCAKALQEMIRVCKEKDSIGRSCNRCLEHNMVIEKLIYSHAQDKQAIK
jgi:hypothetical protein